MISKELLSKVLGIEVKEIRWIKTHKNQLQYDVEEDMDYTTINIHELANKCKEWAIENGYSLASYTNAKAWICRDPYKIEPYLCADTEPEAIFKACQYIMEQENEAH